MTYTSTAVFQYIKEHLKFAIDIDQITNFPFDSSQISKYHPIFANKPFAIHVAAFYGNDELINFLAINEMSLLSQKDSLSRSPAHFAAAGGQLSTLKLLAYNGISISDPDSDNKTIVHYACEYDHLDILKYAYSLRLPLNTNSKKGPPIHIACASCNIRIIEYLCSLAKEFHENISLHHIIYSQTALSIALKNDFYEAIPILIDAGFDISMTVLNGSNALSFTIGAKRVNNSKFLIQHGINVNQPDTLNWTPLHIASQELLTEIVEDLIDHGAVVAKKTLMGMTPWMLANNKLSKTKESTLFALREGVKQQITLNLIKEFLTEEYVEE